MSARVVLLSYWKFPGAPTSIQFGLNALMISDTSLVGLQLPVRRHWILLVLRPAAVSLNSIDSSQLVLRTGLPCAPGQLLEVIANLLRNTPVMLQPPCGSPMQYLAQMLTAACSIVLAL